ncbi:MAG TPA: hotdog fold domain-containing protein [Kofleriaceae bacterium]|nr:hotdog fold domain-containing protein [Kofleriaceae bacterium]
MALADLKRLLPMPRLDGSRNLIRQAWDLMSGMPGGKAVFSRLVGRMAPYTGSIHAHVTVLRSGYAEVEMTDRKAVRNHLDCVHAIALANLAELAGNVALAYSLPDDARFIVSGMEIEYVKKARGTIKAIGESPVPRSSTRAAYDVPVTLRDAAGEEVARAVLHSLVGPKPGAATDRRDVN